MDTASLEATWTKLMSIFDPYLLEVDVANWLSSATDDPLGVDCGSFEVSIGFVT